MLERCVLGLACVHHGVYVRCVSVFRSRCNSNCVSCGQGWIVWRTRRARRSGAEGGRRQIDTKCHQNVCRALSTDTGGLSDGGALAHAHARHSHPLELRLRARPDEKLRLTVQQSTNCRYCPQCVVMMQPPNVHSSPDKAAKDTFCRTIVSHTLKKYSTRPYDNSNCISCGQSWIVCGAHDARV